MKLPIAILSALLLLGLPARAQQDPQPQSPPPPPTEPAVTQPQPQRQPRVLTPEQEALRAQRRAARQAVRRAERQAQQPAPPARPTQATPSPATPLDGIAINPPATPPPTAATPTAPGQPPAQPGADPELRLNFRGVPLDMVLDYLSEAAGFIILLETQVRGTVDVWSNQPLTRAEAVDLLNAVLSKNGYAAVQSGRTLTIVSKDDAKKRNLPVKSGADPDTIPSNEEMVTQIMPVRYISAPQLVQDLASLMPPSATIAANQGGNAIIITDTQANIRRLAEIIAALDTSMASASSIRVFPLRFADAKALATTLRELFPDTTRTGAAAGGRGGAGGFQFPGFGGFGGGAGGRGGGGGGGNNNANQAPAEAKRVVAVADEHSNSLIVSASEDMMATVTQLIRAVDTDVQDLTELRVFPLKNSDPTEMADLLSNLFPDTTQQNDQNRGGGFRFGGGGGPGGGGPFGRNNAATAASERTKIQGKVIAVPDPRTSSVIVSAAKELMPQIDAMIAQLDLSPAKKQKVFVYSLDNADVSEVEMVLRSLFESQNSRNTQNANQQNNALQNRANNNTQSQGLNNQGGGGGGGFGGGGLGGGGGGGFR